MAALQQKGVDVSTYQKAWKDWDKRGSTCSDGRHETIKATLVAEKRKMMVKAGKVEEAGAHINTSMDFNDRLQQLASEMKAELSSQRQSLGGASAVIGALAEKAARAQVQTVSKASGAHADSESANQMAIAVRQEPDEDAENGPVPSPTGLEDDNEDNAPLVGGKGRGRGGRGRGPNKKVAKKTKAGRALGSAPLPPKPKGDSKDIRNAMNITKSIKGVLAKSDSYAMAFAGKGTIKTLKDNPSS